MGAAIARLIMTVIFVVIVAGLIVAFPVYSFIERLTNGP